MTIIFIKIKYFLLSSLIFSIIFLLSLCPILYANESQAENVQYQQDQPNYPSDFQARVTYGPIEISWATKMEHQNKIFIIERLQENCNWIEVGRQKGNGISVFPTKYQIDDISLISPGTPLVYRIAQINENEDIFYTPQISINYLPNPSKNQFHFVYFDSNSSKVNLSFQTTFPGKVIVRLFNKSGTRVCKLFEKDIEIGNYSCLLNFPTNEKISTFVDGFCRIQILDGKQKQSFIQIQPVRTKNLHEFTHPLKK